MLAKTSWIAALAGILAVPCSARAEWELNSIQVSPGGGDEFRVPAEALVDEIARRTGYRAGCETARCRASSRSRGCATTARRSSRRTAPPIAS